MPNRAQNVADLAQTLQRIADGEGYIERMEGLIDRAVERGEATAELREYLQGMRVLLQTFKTNRDVLIKAIEALDSPGPGNAG